MSLEILGIGTAVPVHTIVQQDAAEFAKALCCRTEQEIKQLEMLYKRTRIRTRGSVLLERENGSGLQQTFFPSAPGSSGQGPTTEERMKRYEKEAAPLALAACERALYESQVLPSKITHLITVSCTGFAAPGVDIALIKELGLQKNVARMHVGFMGCHGALNGLRIASALADSELESCILLCAVELCSLHFFYGWDPEKIIANGLFADGAAALIGAPAGEKNSNTWKVQATGSALFPNSENAMTWRIGNHGFEMTLSASVPVLIVTHLRTILIEWLTKHGTSIEEIRSWAIHPGGPRIINEIAACLNLPEKMVAVSRSILAEHGNMSSPTLLFILQRLRQEKAPRPCLALGFGPGLAAEMALFA